MLLIVAASASEAAQLRLSLGEATGFLMRLCERTFDLSQLLRERIVRRSPFCQLNLVPGLRLGTLLSGRLQFGRVPALGGLERLLRLDQTPPERVPVRDFLRELRVELRSSPGEPLGFLMRLCERTFGLSQLLRERIERRDPFC